MYQYAPDHNAVLRRASFHHQWAFDTKAKINGGLAVVGNTVIVGTFAPQVLALDARTGKSIWRTGGLRNIVMSTPVVAGGYVYVGTGTNSERTFSRFTIEHWLYHGKDILGVPGGDEVVALNLANGRVRWRFPTLGEDMPSPVYDRGRLVFANGDWHAYALDAVTGKELWKRYIGGASTMASATVAQHAVIVAQCASDVQDWTLSLDPRVGKVLWRAPYGDCDGAPSYAAGKIFAPGIQLERVPYVARTIVAALNPKNGRPLWVYRAPNSGAWTYVSSAEGTIAGTYANGIYFQPEPFSDKIVALDYGTGRVRWELHTSGPVKMSPLVAGTHLYAGDTAGVLYDVNARTGALLAARPFEKPFSTTPPVIVGQTMFLVNDQSVYAVDIAQSNWMSELFSMTRKAP